MKSKTVPTQKEVTLGEDEFIVSKTDGTGKITYINRVFMQISGYAEAELLNKQHNIIRHPDMPRGVFKFMWDTLKGGDEFIGFVKNLCKDGGYYWVFAHVTPDFDANGNFRGYYSVRRKPSMAAVETASNLYQEMIKIEQRAGSRDACEASIKFLKDALKERNLSYTDFVLQMDIY